MNIIFAGTPVFAAISLDRVLNAGYNVIGVYTQPDRPAGRGKKLVPSPVKVTATKYNLPVFQPEKLTNTVTQAALADLKPDLMIVAAYGLLLPKAVLDIPSHGCVNIHASLLPRWRGAAPIQRAIQSGDQETGITIMQMDEGLDTGDMLLKLSTPIIKEDTGGTLHDRLAELGGDAILAYLQAIKNKPLTREKQQDADSCYAKKLSKQEANIQWQDSAIEIARSVRAFNPWPVSFTTLAKNRVRILAAHPVDGDNKEAAASEAGKVVSKSRDGIVVQCGKGKLCIEQLQLPGAKALSVADFVNGSKPLLEPGDTLGADL